MSAAVAGFGKVRQLPKAGGNRPPVTSYPNQADLFESTSAKLRTSVR